MKYAGLCMEICQGNDELSQAVDEFLKAVAAEVLFGR
jgi:hypothetical protein